jgi:RHS repeat-associated protein
VPGQIGSTYWLIKDQVGSTTDVLNANGQQVNHIDYTTFGQFQILDPNTGTYTLSPTPPAGTVTTHLFTGREFNAETGDYYYRAREYDSAIGRFEGEDPLDMAAGMNQFEYVGDAPVMGNDPFGLKVNFIPFEGAGAIPAASKCDVQLAKNEFKKIEDLAKEMEKKGHSELQQVLNHLKRKDVTYNIIVYPYMASHSDFTTYGDTKGNSAKTYFDPYAEASFDQNAPDYKRHALTPIIALIHELGHAYDYSGGAPIFPVQPISDLYTKNETRTSVQLENMVRGYLFGQDQLRTVYSEDATINPSSTPLKP